MHRLDIVNWLKTRNNSHTKKKYLYYPDELLKNIEIKKMFKVIDADGSSIFFTTIIITD